MSHKRTSDSKQDLHSLALHKLAEILVSVTYSKFAFEARVSERTSFSASFAIPESYLQPFSKRVSLLDVF